MDPVGALWIIPGLLGYFLPVIIALKRDHHQTTAIFGLNLLLGWTLIGWVVSLVWALTAVKTESRHET